MRSALPKVLHPLAGSTILERVLGNLRGLTMDHCFVVVGHGADLVRARIKDPRITFVEQSQQLGTGHAVQQVLPLLPGFEGEALVLYGDSPLLRPETLENLVTVQRAANTDATMLTAHLEDPTGYGRVFLNESGQVERIVEHRDCTAAERNNLQINPGVYCYRWSSLSTVLPKLRANNDQGELYLTDTVAQMGAVGAVAVEDVLEVLGINDRVQLAEASRILNERTLLRLMRAGVTFTDPSSVTVDDLVEIEPDAVIEPETHLRGRTRIGRGCRIGPGSLIENAIVEPDTEVLYSVVRDTHIGARCQVGPYTHLRGGAIVGEGCRLGNFVELKNSTLGARTNAAHLSYLGDATVGERVNIAAGTITANYDGRHKHRTVIGSGSKTGVNSVLIAPLTLGEDVTVAAGSTVTEDVPAGALVIARSRQVVKPDWQPKSTSE